MKFSTSLFLVLFSFFSKSQSTEVCKLYTFQGDIGSSLNVTEYIDPNDVEFFLVDVPFFEIEYLKDGYTDIIDTSDSSFPGMHFFIESFFDSIKKNRFYGLIEWAYQYPFYMKKLDTNALNLASEILDSEKCKSSHKPANGLSKLKYDFSLPPEMIDSLINLFDSNLTPIQERFMRYYYSFPDNEFGTKPNFWLCSGLFDHQKIAFFTESIGPFHKDCYSAKVCYHVFIKSANKRKRTREVKKQFSVRKRKFKNQEMVVLKNGDLLQVHYVE